ncbi:MAG: hypothetical protein ABJQ71_17495 [Roseibium sp.]
MNCQSLVLQDAREWEQTSAGLSSEFERGLTWVGQSCKQPSGNMDAGLVSNGDWALL